MRSTAIYPCGLVACVLALSACGGGGGSSSAPAIEAAPVAAGEPAGFSLSGTIGLAAQVELDADLNDTVATAQRISNPVQVAGYADTVDDARDLFTVLLSAGDRINLYVEGDGVADDLDLNLLAEDGAALASAAEAAGRETIIAPASGDHLIEVSAFSGSANYVLIVTKDVSEVMQAQPEFVPGQVLVRFADLEDGDEMSDRINAMGLNWTRGSAKNTALVSCNSAEQRDAAFARMGMDHLLSDDPDVRRLSEEEQVRRDTPRMAKALRRRADVASADPNYLRRTFAVPQDAGYPAQWHYPAINAETAWDLVAPESGVIVAVIDTGVTDHPDLAGQVVAGYDFIQNPAIANDGDGCDVDADDPGDSRTPGASSYHGTHVSGTIVARTSLQPGGSTDGVAGLAWNARVMPLRAIGVGGGTDFDVMQALLYAAGLANDCNVLPAQRAQVVNMSLGGPGFSATFESVVAQARAAGVVVVASSGNSNSDVPMYPASFDGVISVAATDISGERASYSSFGNGIDVAAPGGDNSTDLNDDGFADGVLSLGVDDLVSPREFNYRFSSGTSMSSPHAAAVFALMLGANPALTPGDVDTMLAAGMLTLDLGNPAFYGFGLIDANLAVRAAFAAAGVDPDPVPARLGVDPANLSFPVGVTELVLTAANAGNAAEALSLVSVRTETDDGAPWLSVSAETVDASGLGTYRVRVDRTGLVGPAVLSGRVVIDSSENDLVVPVSLDVPAPVIDANAGPLQVLLLDPQTSETAHSIRVEATNGAYTYRFDAVPPGNFNVFAGSDRDLDGRICDAGEACGALGDLATPSPVATNLNRTGIDFDVSLRYGPGADGATGYPATVGQGP